MGIRRQAEPGHSEEKKMSMATFTVSDFGAIDADMCKTDALIMGHNISHKIDSAVYVVETKWGWTCAKNKPSLRFGKVIECYQGKECIA